MDIFQKIASVFKWHTLMCVKSFPYFTFLVTKLGLQGLDVLMSSIKGSDRRST
jgi:hypothetical protein